MEHQGSQPHRGLAALVRNKWTQRIVYLLIIPALLLYALWLPPASLGARLFHTDYPVITPDGGGTVPGPEGARLEVPAGAVAKRLRLRLDALTADDVAALKPDRPEAIAAQALPADVTLHGPLYRIDALGDAPSAATVTLPVPYDLSNLALAELYGWDGSQWQWLPAQVQPGGTEIAAQVDTLPAMFVVAEAQPSDPRIAFGTSISEGEGQLATADAPVILHGVQIDEEGLPGGPYTGDGTAEAELTSHALGKMLSISNVVDGVARSDWVENIISDATTRKAHIDAIVALASGWASALPDARGIEIAYDGVSAVAREAMTAFVQELAAALHAAGQQLAVRIDPAAVGTSDSGYDLRAIGAAADVVRVAAPSDPAAYADGTIDHLLTQLTAAVDRRKLELVIDTYARRGTGDGSEALIEDVAIGQTPTGEWEVTQLFVRKPRIGGSPFSLAKGPTAFVPWSDVTEDAERPGEDQTADHLLEEMNELLPADATAVLLDLPDKRLVEVARQLAPDRLADLVAEMGEDDQGELLTALGQERAAEVLDEMQPDDAADLIASLPSEVGETLLELMEPEEADDVRALLVYEHDTAGGLMSPEPIIVSADATVAEGLALIRRHELAPAMASLVCVTLPPYEAPTGRFLGVVHFQRMLRYPPHERLGALVDPGLEPLHVGTSLAEVARDLASYNLVSLPVVDDAHRLVGIVTIDDVLDHLLPDDWRTADTPSISPTTAAIPVVPESPTTRGR